MLVASPVGHGEQLLAVFGDEHADYRARVRRVVEGLAPDVPQWERSGGLPRELFARLGAAGAFRDRWAAGRTGGLAHALVLAEEIVLLGGGPGAAVTLHAEVFTGTLQRLARTPAHHALLERALDGDVVGCFASSEAHGGSALGAPRVEVTRNADGWHLRGVKRYASNAARSTHAVVLARCPDAEPGRDLCLVLVDLGLPGVRHLGSFATAGLRSCDTTSLEFDVQLDEDAVLGAVGSGLLLANSGLVLERISVAAQSVACARHALGLAIAHARNRPCDGARLLDKQALRHRLADAATSLTAAQAFLHAVVLAAQSGRAISHEAAALKLYAAQVSGHVVDEALQVVGARGYTEHWPLERMYRDGRAARIGAGTDEVMREIVAGGLDRHRAEHEAWVAELEATDVADPALLPELEVPA